MNDSTIQTIKTQMPLLDFVQKRAPLTRMIQLKKTWVGNCPVCGGASLYVFPETGLWHCFTKCDTGGDIFTFVMKLHDCSFEDAAAYLETKLAVEQGSGPES